jgi:hypothetical protein
MKTMLLYRRPVVAAAAPPFLPAPRLFAMMQFLAN